jgi:RimJ/RimL family protein N-acetyltransferase
MIWPERISTDRLVLRRPVDADASAIFEGYGQDPDVVRYLMWRPHASIADTRAFLATRHAGWASGTDLTWALTLGDEDRLIGMIGMRPRGFKHDIGYVLARSHWGRGLMSEAATAIVALALTDPACYRVWALCDADNRASARVMEKAGMSFEGVLRRWVVHPNVSDAPRDALCYARVKHG